MHFKEESSELLTIKLQAFVNFQTEYILDPTTTMSFFTKIKDTLRGKKKEKKVKTAKKDETAPTAAAATAGDVHILPVPGVRAPRARAQATVESLQC